MSPTMNTIHRRERELTMKISATETGSCPFALLSAPERVVRVEDQDDYLELVVDIAESGLPCSYVSVSAGYLNDRVPCEVFTSTIPVARLQEALGVLAGGSRG